MKSFPLPQPVTRLAAAAALACLSAATHATAAGFAVAENAGRIEVRDGDTLVLGWQAAPLARPVGGERFAGSAFIHPLCTPAGFEVTTI